MQEHEALEAVRAVLLEQARAEAIASGAEDVESHVATDRRTAQIEAREVFVEARLRIEVSGRARVARDFSSPCP